MNDDTGQNRLLGRGKGAFLLVNTLKLTVIPGLPLAVVSLALVSMRSNLAYLGAAALALMLCALGGFGASVVAWQKVERGGPDRD